MAGNSNVLEIKDVSVCFDGFYALTEVNAAVKRHSIHFFIGPNGAGKTTLLDIICGKTRPTAGSVIFHPESRADVRLTGMAEYKIVREGVGRKFQVPSVFGSLTVWDNMMLSLKGHKDIWDSLFGRPTADELQQIDRVLDKVGLLDKAQARAGSLAHGQKQWLEIGMQLVQQPEIIMLDEPAAGMGKPETFKTGEILREIQTECTIIVIEHDMDFVRQAADVVTVLHEGKVLTEGTVDEVLADETLPPVRGDAVLVRMLLRNIISNAFKFTRGRENARITVTADEEDDFTVFAIRDNGAGFDMQYADRLFRIFQRLHDDSEFEGTGVGLAMAQRIMERHGGKIRMTGEVNKGATVFLYFPQE